MFDAVSYAALGPIERSLVDAFASGETWSPDYFRTWLARHPGESAPRPGAAPVVGTICGDPDKPRSVQEGCDYGIEAEFIRNVILGKIAGDVATPIKVDEGGLHLENAHIRGTLRLVGIEFREPLEFRNCYFEEPVNLTDARLGRVSFAGCRLTRFIANSAVFRGDLSLREVTGCKFIELRSAQIEDSLNLSKVGLTGREEPETLLASYDTTRPEYVTLDCEEIGVGGNLHMEECKISGGEVRLRGAVLGASLLCDGAEFRCRTEVDPVSGKIGRAFYARGAAVAGSVFLRKAQSCGEMHLSGIHIRGNLRCEEAHLAGLGDAALRCDDAVIDGSANLSGGLVADGEIGFSVAEIGAELNLDGAVLTCETGRALHCNSTTIGTSVFLRDVEVLGEINFVYAKIGGRLTCRGGHFHNPAQSDDQRQGTRAINCDGVTVNGNVFLDTGTRPFTAVGMVYFSHATIGKNFYCTGGQFRNGDLASLACYMTRIEGSAHLNGTFSSQGELFFRGLTVKGSLNFRGGSFDDGLSASSNGHVRRVREAADLERATIGGTLYLTGIRKFRGRLDLQDAYARNLAEDGSLLWYDGKPDRSIDPDVPFEVEKGRRKKCCCVQLDRLRFEAFTDDDRLSPDGDGMPEGKDGSVTDYSWQARFDLLKRQPREWLTTDFRPQPFTQCAKVLRGVGHSKEARLILYLRETLRLRHKRLGWWESAGRRVVFGWFAGHGYKTHRALVALVIVWALGWPIYWYDGLVGQMHAASDNLLASTIYAKKPYLPPDYEPFKPYLYSLDVLLPIVDFGQEKLWTPMDGNLHSPGFERFLPPLPDRWWGRAAHVFFAWFPKCYYWFQIFAGWFLSTIFVAGFTGLIGHPHEE
jgi:hypothetical protein